MNRRLEVCVESVDGVRAAERGGADRVELCGSLLEGGITPSHGLIASAIERAAVAVFVMIRPRGGDFLYGNSEIEVMRREIDVAKELGAHGVVFGVLHADGSIDAERTRELVERARPLAVTFHRAFDLSRDLAESLEILVDIGVARVLTSGGAQTAAAGLARIAQLCERAAARITVVPGGGIDEGNIREIVARSGAGEFHVSARTRTPSPMRHRNEHCTLGRAADEYSRWITSAERVRALAAILSEERP